MPKRILRFFALYAGLLGALTACSGTILLNALAPDAGYSVTRDVAYNGDNSNPRQQLDVYVPAQPDTRHTVVLFFYGGSWQFGSKGDYLFLAQALTEFGYTVVVADYRLHPEVDYPAFLNDSAAALVWVHNNIAQYGGNPDRLFVAGHSAGAYNALMLAVNDSYLRQAGGDASMIHGSIGISGPYNFLPLTDPKLIELFHGAERAETQPYTYATHKTAPVMLATGTADDLVSPNNTTTLAARLQGLGSDVTTHYYDGVGHIGIILSAARGFRGKTTLLPDIQSFIDSH